MIVIKVNQDECFAIYLPGVGSKFYIDLLRNLILRHSSVLLLCIETVNFAISQTFLINPVKTLSKKGGI